ncbi:AtpZ/AtpI family protein [Myroides sp. NP-2]|uniref:AtpZ/AtpI family protein n=1 Tax=Myroides sp. NP-2 TaxID=2759945 RepID=UPI0015F821C0|nr:AtpZ/AtpI family protein [Myroides sp. NP-2]MBB1150986.1 AtpZ/AtpI family protein [Myroides sp. NP-2]
MKNKDEYDSEVGLGDLKGFVEHSIFKVIQYLKKNSIYLALIVIVGGGIGYYLDKKQGTEEQVNSSVMEKGDRLIKRQTAISLNYNSIELVEEWMALYLRDEKWKKAGLVNLELISFKPTIPSNTKGESVSEIAYSNATSKDDQGKIRQGLFFTDFQYYKFVVLAKEGFDFRLFWKDLTQRIEKMDHFSKLQTLHQAFLTDRKAEIIQDLNRLNKLVEKEGIAATDLIEVIQAKRVLEQELITIKAVQMQTSSVLYEAYEINEAEQLIENMRYDPDAVPRKKIQLPIVGLVLFFLGQWMVRINRKYTKNNE